VPGVVGQSAGDAAGLLTSSGFAVRQRNFLGAVVGRVFRQNPGRGRQVPRGSTVTIDVL
jgi:beta-lactam-binding protein with PASTA domain